jgi:triosephosphate isomerase
MSRTLFVATNWKCSIESPSDADRLVESMNAKWLDLPASVRDSVELSVHPPYVFLDRVRQTLDPAIAVGSQNVYDAGGFGVTTNNCRGNTGATSPTMLAGLGVEWILLGHSDRRNNLGETDDLIAEKARLALQPHTTNNNSDSDSSSSMGIVLTLGEKKEERDEGRELDVLRKQLLTVAEAIPGDEATWKKVVLAYEPVWAVGALHYVVFCCVLLCCVVLW